MPYSNRRSSYLNFILLFVAIRVIVNLFALPHFGFQRDEMLHLALGDHLAWGFKEVPPFIAFIARLSTVLFGTSVPAARIFTTVCSGFIVLLTGLLTVELGGKRFAITVACLTLTFSPAFIASGYLLQPVVFDQLWWLLSAYLLVKSYNTNEDKYLYYLGIAIGMGMLTKYTMAFFTAALIAGILLTAQRKVFSNRGIWIAVAIAIIIFLPNIVWQLTHHLPLATHMRKLRSSQLDYVKPSDFLKQQLLVHGAAIWVWLGGLLYLLFSTRIRSYRFMAFAYLFTLLLFLVLNGKNYYLFGAYPMLFAAGGLAFERILKTSGAIVRTVVTALLILPNLILFPLLLPVFSFGQTLALFKAVRNNISFLDFAVTWEDHKLHPTTQDYGDMLGWEELTLRVAKAYRSLTPTQQKQTIIFANNYGEAGAIHHFGKLYNLPDVVSLNSSFALWAPEHINAKYLVYVDETNGRNVAEMLKAKRIGQAQKIGEVDNKYAVETGTAVFILSDLKPGLDEGYRKELLQTRQE
jgi:hypothetical protein